MEIYKKVFIGVILLTTVISSVLGWEAWGRRYNGDYSNQNLYNAFIPQDNFTNADLRGANLTKAYVYDTNFDHANLYGANLTATYGERPSVNGACMANIIGHFPTYSGGQQGSPYTTVEACQRAGFKTFIPQNTMNIKYQNFANQNLTNHNFTGQDLTGANFGGANLNGANFTNAKLMGADLSGAHINQYTNFTGANLMGANFTNLPYGGGGPNFYKANLMNMKFDGDNASGSDVRNACIAGSSGVSSGYFGTPYTSVAQCQKNGFTNDTPCEGEGVTVNPINGICYPLQAFFSGQKQCALYSYTTTNNKNSNVTDLYNYLVQKPSQGPLALDFFIEDGYQNIVEDLVGAGVPVTPADFVKFKDATNFKNYFKGLGPLVYKAIVTGNETKARILASQFAQIPADTYISVDNTNWSKNDIVNYQTTGNSSMGTVTKTPILITALQHNQPSVVEALLKAGANPNLKGTSEVSPLALAVIMGNKDLVMAFFNSANPVKISYDQFQLYNDAMRNARSLSHAERARYLAKFGVLNANNIAVKTDASIYNSISSAVMGTAIAKRHSQGKVINGKYTLGKEFFGFFIRGSFATSCKDCSVDQASATLSCLCAAPGGKWRRGKPLKIKKSTASVNNYNGNLAY